VARLITKSKYLLGLQCPRLLWIAVNRKEAMPEVSDSQQKIFDTGTSIGVLATSLFDGIKVLEDGFIENLLKTKELLKQNKTLFEAGFAYKDLFSRADILEYTENGWNIIEVKSSTEVKEVNLHDVSFQKYVYQKCGLKINKCYLMHINNEYVRQGDLEVSKLFHKEDITLQVDEFIVGIEERLQKMRDVLLADEPESIIGEYCDAPYQCALYDDCWGFLPNNSVFCLSRGGKKSWELFRSDIHKIVDIPDDYKLTDKQQVQKDCELTGLPFVNKEAIKQFISTLHYPIYYFDFETINPAIPLYDNIRPYQRMAFQYSLHIQYEEGGECKHISFLADEKKDPRLEILKAMQRDLGDSGTILAWNQSFEKGVIKELISQFPSYREWGLKILERFNDLMIPFANFSYYNPIQEGSASIKKVLPALTDLSYSGMEISNGGDASNSYEMIATSEFSSEEVERIRNALEKYCELDTWAEVKILEELRKLV